MSDHDVVTTGLIIGGEWRPATGNRTYPIFNPARPEEIVGHAAEGCRADTAQAIERAAAAWPSWARLGFEERAAYLTKIVPVLQSDMDERIRILVRENGKVRSEAILEMTRLGARFEHTAELAAAAAEEVVLEGPPLRTRVIQQPLGVAALFVPWNWPLSILAAKLPQALVAGNTVVVKPPPTAPLATVLTCKLMADILPPGVLNVVTGPDEDVAVELLEHPAVRIVDFTGGTETGKRVMSLAARTVKRLTLELGGNDPAIVLEDVELNDGTVDRLVRGAFLSAGQVCMAIKRLYVHRSVFRQLCEALADSLSQFVVGDGLDPQSTMGPLHSRSRLEFVRKLTADARQSGALVEQFGRPLDDCQFQAGWFHLPTLATGVDHSFSLVSEEQFGPVLPIIPFDDENEAIRLSNDSEYALCSSVWTSDLVRAERIARQLEAGYTFVNSHGPFAQDGRAPFGGRKQSGMGRQLGIRGIRQFLDEHSISVAM